MTIRTSPRNDRYILVSRDARRTVEQPTIPAGWRLEVTPLYADITVPLPEFTVAIAPDTEF